MTGDVCRRSGWSHLSVREPSRSPPPCTASCQSWPVPGCTPGPCPSPPPPPQPSCSLGAGTLKQDSVTWQTDFTLHAARRCLVLAMAVDVLLQTDGSMGNLSQYIDGNVPRTPLTTLLRISLNQIIYDTFMCKGYSFTSAYLSFVCWVALLFFQRSFHTNGIISEAQFSRKPSEESWTFVKYMRLYS